MKRILITGSAGFIGFHLVNKFLKEGYKVIGLDNINEYYDIKIKYARLEELGIRGEKIKYNTIVNSIKNPSYYFIKLDLEDKKNIFKFFDECKIDCIIHLAAQAGVRHSLVNPYQYINSNIYGTLNMLEAARQFQIKDIIYASSSSVYGSNKTYPYSEDDKTDCPISMYAMTKKSNELMAYTYSYLFNIRITGLRFFTVYGPWGRPDMAYFKFTKSILQDKPIEVYNNGEMKRDFTYIDDIIEGIYLIYLKLHSKNIHELNKKDEDILHKIFNVGNSHPVSLIEFINNLEEILGKKATKSFLPLQPGDARETHSDIEKLIKEIHYVPQVSLNIGLTRFINWYLKYYGIQL